MELDQIEKLLHKKRNNKVAHQPTNLKTVFAKHISNKLVFKVHKELENSTASKPCYDWAENKTKHFSR